MVGGRAQNPLLTDSNLTTEMHKVPNDQFQSDVFEITRLIPAGRVSSYGAIAASIGSKGAARRVGWVLNGSFGAIPPVPAHSVVNRLGILSGRMHFPENMTMENLLRVEGVKVEDNRVVNFDGVHWDPLIECLLD